MREWVLAVALFDRPLGVAPLEREHTELGGELRGRFGDTAGDQRKCHVGGQANALERVSLPKFGAGRHGRFQAGTEVAVHLTHRIRYALEPGGDGLERGGAGGRLPDAVGEQLAERLLPGCEDLPLVWEVAEQRALRDAGTLGDLRDRGGVISLLGEQLDRGDDKSLACSRFPSRHAVILFDGTIVSSLW